MTVTLNEMNELIDELAAMRETKKKLSEEEKRLNEQIRQLEFKAMQKLDEAGQTSFHGRSGTIYTQTRDSYKFPKDDKGKKAALRRYLEGKGPTTFDDFWTKDYQSLQAWAKGEVESARERGDVTFEVPGLSFTTDIIICFKGK